MNRIFVFLASALSALVVVGCGSSGGGAAQAPGPTPTGSINTGSALTVAGRAVDAALLSGSFGDLTSFVGLTPVSSGEPGTLGAAKSAHNASWNVTSHVPVGPETTPCFVDGSVTISGDIAIPLSLAPGDFLDFMWEGCDDGLGQILDGEIGMTFTQFEGNLLAGQMLLAVTLTADSFQVTENGSFDLVDGSLDLIIDTRSQTETVVTTLGDSILVTHGSGSTTLTNFTNVVTEDVTVFPSNVVTDTSGTISSTLFDGAVNFDTPIPFEATGDGFPYTGEMLVSGASSARLKIIAISDVDVRVEADFDGDGAVDATTDTTWEALVDG